MVARCLAWAAARRAVRAVVAALVPTLAACGSGPGARPDVPPMPEGASDIVAKPGWATSKFMVAAANPIAAEVGAQVLRDGGSAVDAAVAVQMVLALVEPQSSGLGGGAFLLHWDGSTVQAWDGRETAPAAADERLFLRGDGRPLPFAQATVGGLAVGVPGAVRMLEAVHRAHGRLPWARLFAPAIALAEQGFPVGARLHRLLRAEQALRADPIARTHFFDARGEPHPPGTVLRNPALAAVLRAIAGRGADALHEGPVAADIVARVRGHPQRPGRLAAADLARYAPKLREPLCSAWTPRYRVCGFPPPSSGHLALMQILGTIEHALPAPPALVDGVPGPQWLHVYTEAARLAFADRAQYVGDPDFVDPPAGRWGSLLDDAYLRQRAALIGARSMGRAAPGIPEGNLTAWAPQPAQPEAGTTHIAIVDAQGRAVAMTSSVEAAFGSRLMSDGGTGLPGGFVLNNQLTDFAFVPADARQRPVANRVQPGKRPRSSMSPTFVFDARDGRLLMVAGSAGGASIIHFTAKALVGTLRWGLDAQRAIDLPNFGSANGPTQLEAGRFPAATLTALRERGHEVVELAMASGTQAIARTPAGWFGGADPRREGAAAGD